MDLSVFDAYNLRARLCPSLILLSPIAISIFLCIEKIRTVSATSFFLIILLAFANSIPIIQRRLYEKHLSKSNNNPEKNTEKNSRAAEMLSPSDNKIDSVSKKRYYRKLAKCDESFSPFSTPDHDSVNDELCKSAEIYLRSRTRDNRLVLEENINYGFCKNLIEGKRMGTILCGICFVCVIGISWLVFDTFSAIPFQNYLAAILDLFILLFLLLGMKESDLNRAADNYAKALIMAIDSLDTD